VSVPDRPDKSGRSKLPKSGEISPIRNRRIRTDSATRIDEKKGRHVAKTAQAARKIGRALCLYETQSILSFSSVKSTGKLVPVDKMTGFPKSEFRTSEFEGKSLVGANFLASNSLACQANAPASLLTWLASQENNKPGKPAIETSLVPSFLVGENSPFAPFSRGFFPWKNNFNKPPFESRSIKVAEISAVASPYL
jgi:hypothetical protein